MKMETHFVLFILCLCFVNICCQTQTELDYARKTGLSKHNTYRLKHKAQNLMLSSTLNDVAQAYAYKLASYGRLVHSGNSLYGENLYTYCVWSSRPDVKNAVINATDSWYNEYIYYNYNNPGFSYVTGHFTQLVWIATKAVGFGVSLGKNGNFNCVYVVANYSPPGNYLYQFAQNVKSP